MDHAAMLAENQERERQWRLQYAMQHAPPWPQREDTVQSFAWPYPASELIAERKRVCEILALRAKVENPKVGDSDLLKALGEPISFHEAFISTHEQRRSLMHRLHERYDNHYQNTIVAMRLIDFPWSAPGRFPTDAHFEKEVATWKTGVAQFYLWGKGIMNGHIEALLQMQALCEALAPETRELVTRCSGFEQLDRSMLMVQTPELPDFQAMLNAR